MSYMTNPERLDPRTVTDIRNNACAYCEQRIRGRWSICDFHEGYEAALEEHGKIVLDFGAPSPGMMSTHPSVTDEP